MNLEKEIAMLKIDINVAKWEFQALNNENAKKRYEGMIRKIEDLKKSKSIFRNK